ncbi:MAG: TlpA family protein disulfide reductase [Chitinophagales bacterium]
MNRVLFFCLLLHASLTLTFAQGKAVISGNISDADVEKIQLEVNTYHIEGYEKNLEGNVKEGAFRFEVESDFPQVVYLQYQEQKLPIFVEEGDELMVDFEKGNLTTTATFEGKGAAHNQFLKDFNEKFAADLDIPSMKKNVLTARIDAMEMELFNKRLAQQKMVKEAEKKEWSDAFEDYLDNTIKYNYYNTLFAYPIVRGNNSKNTSVENLPSVMLDNVTPEMANNNKALMSEHYRQFLVYYLTYYSSKANKFKKFQGITPSLTAKHNWGKENIRGESWAYVMTAFVNDNGKDADGEIIRKIYDSVKNTEGGKPYAEIMKDKHGDKMSDKALAAASKAKREKAKSMKKSHDAKGGEAKIGKDVPFTLTNMDGKEITLDQFKGKVVYIDFWASWCGPCRKQFPFAKELKKKLSRKQKKKVEFLYISIDNGEGVWKNAIKKMDIDGYHVLSPGGWKSKVCKYFNIRSIPRYMLLDKKGRIAESNAKRPGQQGTLEDILRLVGEKKKR